MKYLLLSLLLLLSSLQFARAQQLEMSLEWICSTTNTADFQVRLTNTGSVPLTFNALIVRGVHAPSLTTGAISWQALNDNTIPEWLAWPQFTTNLAYNAITRQLNFSSNVIIFTSVTAPLLAPGSNVIVGSFRMFTSTTWVPNSNFNFVWAPTGAVNCYLPGMTTVTSFQQTGVSGSSTCGQCLTVTASIAQPLNLSAPTSPANQSFCSAATVSDLIASPLYISPQIASILWYDTQTGGTALNPTTLLTNGTYYAAQMVNGCESLTRVETIVSINQNNTTSTNVALNKPATANDTYSTSTPSLAFDGLTNNAWQTPTYTGWIQVDLQGSFPVNNIKLYVNQTPNGITTHEIYSAPSISGPWTFVEALTGFTSFGQILVRDYSASPLLNVGAIKVQTTNSPSWVSWGEIEVYSGSLSESITASGPLTFCDGNSVTLSASSGAGYTYQWKKDGLNITSANTSTYVATTTGSYTLVITNSVGCSSTTSATEVLVNLSTTPIFTQVSPICAGDMLSALPTNSINNITGTWSPALSNLASTTYTFTPTSGLCATTQTMDLTITPSSINTTPIISACGTYTWANNGQTYTTSGIYTGATVNCVTEILDLTITPSTTNTTPINSCGTYTWANNGQTYTASGIYSGTTANCVTETLDLTITPSTSNTTPISACGTYTWANNGQTYTASGLYSETTANCVTEILDLTINPSTSNTTPISACGTYTWLNNGQTYTTSGTYTGATINCVTETLDLTITPSTSNTTPISACGTYTWANNGQTYTASGIYSGTTANCVTEILDLTITPSTTNTTPTSACGTYTWANNGQTYTASGIYLGTITNCITEILNLTITPSTINTTLISSCGSYTWLNNSQTYTTSGIYSGTTANCVTETLNLTITPNSTNITPISACGTYTWLNNGQTYTASGTYSGTTTNCVTQTIDLTIIPSTTNTTPISACGAYTWANNGQTYTTSGIYSGTTANCISETLNLTITPSTTNTTPISACGTFTWANNGQTYTTSGVFNGTTTNCITEVLNLSVTPNSSFTTTISECNTYTWANNGQTYMASGVFNGTVINCVLQVLDLEIIDCISDSDNDGLTDYEESFLCTNSSLFDTDGDGLSDGDEDAQGSDPCDPCNPSINSVNCILGIHIPTAFSPNGSGFSENNVYQIIAGQDIAEIAFKIIDRWGNILFESEDKEFQWDGSYKGQKCNNGLYAYFVDVSYSNGKKEKLSGNITMIR